MHFVNTTYVQVSDMLCQSLYLPLTGARILQDPACLNFIHQATKLCFQGRDAVPRDIKSRRIFQENTVFLL